MSCISIKCQFPHSLKEEHDGVGDLLCGEEISTASGSRMARQRPAQSDAGESEFDKTCVHYYTFLTVLLLDL